LAAINLDFHTDLAKTLRITVPEYNPAVTAAEVKGVMEYIIANSAEIVSKAGAPVSIKAAAVVSKTETDVWQA
jgi:hypothetical protein